MNIQNFQFLTNTTESQHNMLPEKLVDLMFYHIHLPCYIKIYCCQQIKLNE